MPSPTGPTWRIVAREDRRQRDRPAEEDGEEVERDRAEQHSRPQHEPHAVREPGEAGRPLDVPRERRRAQCEQGAEREREEYGGDAVDRLGLDREEDAADRGAGDHGDLAGDRPQRHRPGQDLDRHELRRQRAERRPADRARDAGRGGEQEERPD